mmetsp:Transcript_21058/g.66144  ORF Transcript_21058/g.66144 Transcript_21058/m.66144 type:complete len:268 (+) Transcript_21058:172-975(+)
MIVEEMPLVGAPPRAEGYIDPTLRAALNKARVGTPPRRGLHPALALGRSPRPPNTPPPPPTPLAVETPSPPRVPRVSRPGSTGSSTASSTETAAERSMTKMLSHLGPPQSAVVSRDATDDPAPAKPPRWRSLRSRGAKLYAWSTAARLSAEGRGAGVSLNFYAPASSPGDPDRKSLKREVSETSLELLRLKSMRKDQKVERAKRERELALEATTRMLDYLGAEEGPPGARLSIDALREIGADAEGGADDRRRGHRRTGSAGSAISSE